MLESLVAIITLGFVYELVSWCYRIAYSIIGSGRNGQGTGAGESRPKR